MHSHGSIHTRPELAAQSVRILVWTDLGRLLVVGRKDIVAISANHGSTHGRPEGTEVDS